MPGFALRLCDIGRAASATHLSARSPWGTGGRCASVVLFAECKEHSNEV